MYVYLTTSGVICCGGGGAEWEFVPPPVVTSDPLSGLVCASFGPTYSNRVRRLFVIRKNNKDDV